MMVFDRAHVRSHRARARPENDFLFRHALEIIAERLTAARRFVARGRDAAFRHRKSAY